MSRQALIDRAIEVAGVVLLAAIAIIAVRMNVLEAAAVGVSEWWAELMDTTLVDVEPIVVDVRPSGPGASVPTAR